MHNFDLCYLCKKFGYDLFSQRKNKPWTDGYR